MNAWDNLQNLISQPNTNYDLMKLINSLSNCEVIKMKPFQSELQPINLRKLKELRLNGKISSIKISSIKDYSFYECDEIELIDLSWNKIDLITENAFNFENESDKQLRIILNDNKLKESSFALNSLKNIKRATILSIKRTGINHLKKEIFKPFLYANEKNQVQIDVDSLRDHSKLNFWYVKYAKSDFIDYISEESLEITINMRIKAQGADIESSDKYILTTDSIAEDDRLDIVKYLKEQGTDIRTSDEDGVTPLHRATRCGRLDVVKDLIEQGADIKISDNNGSTPLHWAAQYGKLDIVKYLISQDNDIEVRDKNGDTPIQCASQHKQRNIVKYLVEKGADIKTTDKYGNTILQTAFRQNNGV